MKKIAIVSALGLTLAGLGIAAVQAQQGPNSSMLQQAHWRGGGNHGDWDKRDRHHGGDDDNRADGRANGRDGGPRPGMMRRLEQFDLNKDGAVTQAEIDQFRKDQIAKYDTDKNGSLSLSEYQVLWADQMRERMVRAFQKNDRDGDGQVTLDEFDRRFANVVARMDRNGDGRLSRDDRRGWRHGPQEAAPAPAQPGATAPQPTPAPQP